MVKKRRNLVILCVAFLIIFSSIAAAEDINNSEIFQLNQVTVDISSSSRVGIQEGDMPRITYVKAFIAALPRDEDAQSVDTWMPIGSALSKDPIGENKTLDYAFSRENKNLNILDKGFFDIGYDARVSKQRQFVRITKKVAFPFADYPHDVEKYTWATDNIDMNDYYVRQKAIQLAGSESDLFTLEYRLADWVNTNIQYNLSTATAEVSQKASWVLENRQGVCDEISSLFIAFNRALGIPARFVSGIAYTNSDLFTEHWGPHGWTEVYFPDYGWVPYDVTYGEIGFVDASHIVLQRSSDGTKPSTTYEWSGEDFDLSPQQFSTKTTLVKKGLKTSPELDIKLAPISENVGIGSYNLVEATITNAADYYQAVTLIFSQTDNLAFEDTDKQTILLKPRSSAKIHRVLKVTDQLSEDYIYTFPVVIHTTSGMEAKTEFKVAKRFTSIAREDIMKIVDKAYPEEKQYVFTTECSNDAMVMLGKELTVACAIRNNGKRAYQEVDVCFMGTCEKREFLSGQSNTIEFTVKAAEPIGKKYPLVTLTTPDFKEESLVIYEVVAKPKVVITSIDYPAEVAFNEPLKIDFKIAPETVSPVKNLKVQVLFQNKEKKWVVEELVSEQEFEIELNSRLLALNKNNFIVLFEYEDNYGNTYSQRKELNITLKDLNIVEYFFAFLNQFV